jgi:homoserine dehydrogenase
MVVIVNIVVVGFGNVGKKVVERLNDPFFSGLRIKAVFSSMGGVVLREKSDYDYLFKLSTMNEPLSKHPHFNKISFMDYVQENPSGIAIFVIPPSYETGEPNLSMYRKAITSGYHIVTADKTGLAFDYQGLKKLARQYNVLLKYTATVAAGTPVLSVAKSLKYRKVQYIRAILNATSNYVLNLIESGKNWDEAISQAIKEGLAEPNPSIDIDGLDAAAKITILLNEMGINITMKDVDRKSLRIYSEEEIRKAIKESLRLKQVAGYDSANKEVFVKPIFVPLISPLAFTEGAYNTVEFKVEDDSIIIHGPAGPAWRTANVLLADVLEVLDEALGNE